MDTHGVLNLPFRDQHPMKSAWAFGRFKSSIISAQTWTATRLEVSAIGKVTVFVNTLRASNPLILVCHGLELLKFPDILLTPLIHVVFSLLLYTFVVHWCFHQFIYPSFRSWVWPPPSAERGRRPCLHSPAAQQTELEGEVLANRIQHSKGNYPGSVYYICYNIYINIYYNMIYII
jgi:hypothetical protein